MKGVWVYINSAVVEAPHLVITISEYFGYLIENPFSLNESSYLILFLNNFDSNS